MEIFDRAIQDEAGLRELYEMPSELVARKEIDHLDEHCRHYLALCRFALINSVTIRLA